MNTIFGKFFKRANQKSNESNLLDFEQGLIAYNKGCDLFDNRNDEEALKYFDSAINYGVKQAYQERGLCLNSLQYYLDAIDDFNKAIELTPTDCNLYFCRGLAKEAVGDYDSAILDGELAVTYSKFDTELNKEREKKYQSEGYGDFRITYQLQLEGWKMNFKRYEDNLKFIENLKAKGDIAFANEELERSERLIKKNSKRRIQ